MKKTKNTDTIGIDLGDKSHERCRLNAAGEVIGRRSVLNNQAALIGLSIENAGATAIMEAGTHLPWISRLLEGRTAVALNILSGKEVETRRLIRSFLRNGVLAWLLCCLSD